MPARKKEKLPGNSWVGEGIKKQRGARIMRKRGTISSVREGNGEAVSREGFLKIKKEGRILVKRTGISKQAVRKPRRVGNVGKVGFVTSLGAYGRGGGLKGARDIWGFR